MKKNKIVHGIFIVVGILGFLEYTFVKGLFTGTLMMLVSAFTGIVSVIYCLFKKDFHSAILYALLFATIVSAYLYLM